MCRFFCDRRTSRVKPQVRRSRITIETHETDDDDEGDSSEWEPDDA